MTSQNQSVSDETQLCFFFSSYETLDTNIEINN